MRGFVDALWRPKPSYVLARLISPKTRGRLRRECRDQCLASAKVQAIGYDSEGRLQYLYHPTYRERKERQKFERVLRFADALPKMRRVTTNHLRHKRLDREKVLAAMTRLMNAAYFRVGDERYAKKNKTYGITTLRRKHLRIEGDTMIFEYTGKWIQKCPVTRGDLSCLHKRR